MLWVEQAWQKPSPHERQWCFLSASSNARLQPWHFWTDQHDVYLFFIIKQLICLIFSFTCCKCILTFSFIYSYIDLQWFQRWVSSRAEPPGLWARQRQLWLGLSYILTLTGLCNSLHPKPAELHSGGLSGSHRSTSIKTTLTTVRINGVGMWMGTQRCDSHPARHAWPLAAPHCSLDPGCPSSTVYSGRWCHSWHTLKHSCRTRPGFRAWTRTSFWG